LDDRDRRCEFVLPDDTNRDQRSGIGSPLNIVGELRNKCGFDLPPVQLGWLGGGNIRQRQTAQHCDESQ